MANENSDFFPAALHAPWSPDRPLHTGNAAPSPARRVELNIAIRNLLPDRVLRITAIDVDEDALNVHYEVTPPINVHPEDVSGGGLLRYAWYLAGRDDLGNQYDTGGGAYGLGTDGQRTEGVHSLMPAPAAGASRLDIAFYTDTAGGSEHPFKSARYVLRVHLPLIVDEQLERP